MIDILLTKLSKSCNVVQNAYLHTLSREPNGRTKTSWMVP